MQGMPLKGQIKVCHGMAAVIFLSAGFADLAKLFEIQYFHCIAGDGENSFFLEFFQNPDGAFFRHAGQIGEVLARNGHFERILTVNFIREIKNHVGNPPVHLFLGQADHLVKIKNGLERYPFDEFFCKIGVFADQFFKNGNIYEACCAVFNRSRRIIMAVVNIDPGAKDVIDRFDQGQDKVFPVTLNINFSQARSNTNKIRRRCSLFKYDLTCFITYLEAAAVDQFDFERA